MFGKALEQDDCIPVKFASPIQVAQRSMTSGSLLTPLSLRVLVHILEDEAPTHRPDETANCISPEDKIVGARASAELDALVDELLCFVARRVAASMIDPSVRQD